jgi:hypothetical protein
MRALALLALVACSEADAQSIAAKAFPRGCRDRSCLRFRLNPAVALDPFVASEDFNFGGAGAVSSLPPCVGDAHCTMLCYVDETPQWLCIDNTGATLSGVTQGVGMSYAGTFAFAPDGGFWNAMHFIDDTSNNNRLANINNAAVRTALSGSTWFLMTAAYSSTLVTTGPQWWFGIKDSDTDFIQIRAESGNFLFIDSIGSVGAAGMAIDGWATPSFRRDDATHMTARMYGVSGQTAQAKQGALGSGSLFFGGAYTPCCSPGGSLGGDMAWVYLRDDAPSDDTIHQWEKNWYGVPRLQSGGNGTVGTVAGSGTGLTCRPPQDGGYYVDCFNNGAYLVDRKLGVYASRGWQNAWSSTPLDVNTWTDVATPTIGASAIVSPFSRMKSTNVCKLMTDNDGAAFEGKRSGELGTKLISAQIPALDGGFGVWANASCTLAAGTAGTTTDKARIRFITDGTFDAGSSTCDITGLTSTPSSYPGADGISTGCYAWIDLASTIKADVLVGTAAAETGSVTVCECRITNTAFKDLPTTHSVQAGANWPELDGGSGRGAPSAGFPFGPRKGAVDVVFALPFSTSLYGTGSVNLNKVIGPYLVDAYHAGDTHDLLMALSAFVSNPSTTVKPGVQALLYGDSGTYENRFDIPSFDTQARIDFTQGQFYVMRYEWRTDPAPGPTGESPSCRGKLYIDTCSDPDTCVGGTTLIASNAAGDDLIQSTAPGTCPQDTDVVDIGTRQQGTSPSTMNLRRITYYR